MQVIRNNFTGEVFLVGDNEELMQVYNLLDTQEACDRLGVGPMYGEKPILVDGRAYALSFEVYNNVGDMWFSIWRIDGVDRSDWEVLKDGVNECSDAVVNYIRDSIISYDTDMYDLSKYN